MERGKLTQKSHLVWVSHSESFMVLRTLLSMHSATLHARISSLFLQRTQRGLGVSDNLPKVLKLLSGSWLHAQTSSQLQGSGDDAGR